MFHCIHQFVQFSDDMYVLYKREYKNGQYHRLLCILCILFSFANSSVVYLGDAQTTLLSSINLFQSFFRAQYTYNTYILNVTKSMLNQKIFTFAVQPIYQLYFSPLLHWLSLQMATAITISYQYLQQYNSCTCGNWHHRCRRMFYSEGVKLVFS